MSTDSMDGGGMSGRLDGMLGASVMVGLLLLLLEPPPLPALPKSVG